ncbi:MAG: HXXEE domain-containing protein [Pseudomonadota bacterium]
MPQRSFLFFLIGFSFLWIPLGQHGFLVSHWMKVGTFMAPFLLGVALAFRGTAQAPSTDDPRWLSLLLLMAYIAHQFEEHWIDALGRTYAFFESTNSLILRALGAPSDATGPLTPEAVFVINTSLVWLVGALAIVAGRKRMFAPLAMAAIVLVNAVVHIGAGLGSLSYNPGLLTSVFVFVPLSLWVYRRFLQDGLVSRTQIALSLAWAVGAHIVMVAGMIGANWHNLYPEWVYFLALIVWSLLPALIPSDAHETA